MIKLQIFVRLYITRLRVRLNLLSTHTIGYVIQNVEIANIGIFKKGGNPIFSMIKSNDN